MKITPVIGGRFYCETCGCSWVGTWHGPREQMTCPRCEAQLYPDDPEQPP